MKSLACVHQCKRVVKEVRLSTVTPPLRAYLTAVTHIMQPSKSHLCDFLLTLLFKVAVQLEGLMSHHNRSHGAVWTVKWLRCAI